jgi:hypothetical protein
VKTVACLVLLLASTAGAGERFGPSPRSMMLEIKLGPYVPEIDSAFQGVMLTPYASTFGTPMLLGEVEFDYQIFQNFGSLSAAFSVGYAEKFTKAREAGTTLSSDNATGLRLLPVKLMAVYRFDVLNEKFSIPVVPYVKAGAAVLPWWVAKGADIEFATDSAGLNGSRGQGVKYGFTGAAGLSLCLDFLDRRMAHDFDTGLGVNHTYLFAEFATEQFSLFNAATNTLPLDLDSKHVLFGLALEF